MCSYREHCISEDSPFDTTPKGDYLGKGGIGQRFFIYRRKYVEFECV
jgi:hypothetical protein